LAAYGTEIYDTLGRELKDPGEKKLSLAGAEWLGDTTASSKSRCLSSGKDERLRVKSSKT